MLHRDHVNSPEEGDDTTLMEVSREPIQPFHPSFQKQDEKARQPVDNIMKPLFVILRSVLTESMGWVLDVLRLALGNIKQPLSYLVGLWILLVTIDAVRNGAANLASTALSQICLVPGVSWVAPFCHSSDWSPCTNPIIRSVAPSICSDYSTASQAAKSDFNIDELMDVQGKLGQILEEKKEVVSLPYDMTRSNGALMDLKDSVLWSDLPSRQELGQRLDKYITVAEQVVNDLNDFSLQCSSLVDSVIILNRFTLHRVEQLAAKEEQLQASFALQLSTWFSTVFFPFSTETTEEKILDRYMDHMSRAIEFVDQVIEQAVNLNTKLQEGRYHLNGIQRLANEESDRIKTDSEDILEYLWNLVKGVSPPSRNLSKQLPLLHQINSQRELAMTKTSILAQDLSVIRGNLKDLKSKMSTPGYHVGFSLRIHIATISNAAMSLEAVRVRVSNEEDERREQARRNFGLNRHGMFIEAV